MLHKIARSYVVLATGCHFGSVYYINWSDAATGMHVRVPFPALRVLARFSSTLCIHSFIPNKVSLFASTAPDCPIELLLRTPPPIYEQTAVATITPVTTIADTEPKKAARI